MQVIQQDVLPEVSELNDSISTKKRDQIQFYPGKVYSYCLSQQLVRRTKIGGILYKADKDPDPGPLEKVDSTRKFTVWVKDSFLDKFKGADFKYDNSF